jgi:hypothetical protein
MSSKMMKKNPIDTILQYEINEKGTGMLSPLPVTLLAPFPAHYHVKIIHPDSKSASN